MSNCVCSKLECSGDKKLKEIETKIQQFQNTFVRMETWITQLTIRCSKLDDAIKKIQIAPVHEFSWQPCSACYGKGEVYR